MKQMFTFKKVFPIVLAVILLQTIYIADSQAAPPASGGCHRVSYGETLSSIGRRYGVNPYAIARANGLYNPNYIYAGQVLCIPSGRGYDNYSNYNNRYDNGYNNYNYRYNNHHNRYYNNYNNRYYNNYQRGWRYHNHYNGYGRYSNNQW